MRSSSVGVSIDHRPAHRWRGRHVFGAAGLRRPAAQHSQAESAVLRRFATGASTVVELGVAEGCSAAELRSVIAPSGTIRLIDPYEPGRLGISMPLIVARRLLARIENGNVQWRREKSYDAVVGWQDPIDFLFIDGDHSLEGVTRDWQDWTPHVRPDGCVALHDARLFPGGWTDETYGSVRFRDGLSRAGGWTEVAAVDSLVVLKRHQ